MLLYKTNKQHKTAYNIVNDLPNLPDNLPNDFPIFGKSFWDVLGRSGLPAIRSELMIFENKKSYRLDLDHDFFSIRFE